MTKRSWFRCFFAGLLFFSTGCSFLKKRALNIYLKSFQDQKAEGLVFSPPPSPYEKQEHPVLDALWWNPQSASSISYFSSCSKARKALKQFQKESFPQDSQYKIFKNIEILGGVYSVLEIQESGRKTYSGIYTVKKGKCYFNINLVVSSHSSFEKEEPVFKTFIKSFRFQ